MASIDLSRCRMCLNDPPMDSLVFSAFDTFQGRILTELIDDLFAIKILNDDRLQTVCLDCVNRINTVHKIKQFFIKNDQKLQDMLQSDVSTNTFEEEVVYTVYSSHLSSDREANSQKLDAALPKNIPLVKAVVNTEEENATCNLSSNLSATTDNLVLLAIEQERFDEDLRVFEDSDSKDDLPTDANKNQTTMEKSSLEKSEKMPIPPHKCYLCGVIFEGALEFTQHMPTHFDQVPYTCMECDGLVFKTVREASKHVGLHDANERPFKCRICPLRFPTRVNSLTHERKLHRFKLKQMQSLKANDTAKRKSIAKRVSLVNGNPLDGAISSKQYQCEICAGKFTAKKNLTRHLMIHTGEKPFKCDLCHRAYRQAGELKTHMRIHQKECDEVQAGDKCDKSVHTASATLTSLRKSRSRKIARQDS